MTAKVSGIYAIVAPSGRMYIGSSADIPTRFAHHRNALKRGDHANVALRAAFAKYGDALAYGLLEICPVAALVEREQAWIDAGDFAELYNIAAFVESPARGRKVPETTKAKMRAAALGRVNSPETREKMKGPRVATPAVLAHVRARAEALRGKPRTDLPVGRSGYRGVYKQARGGWFARIGVGSMRRSIGTFHTPDLAYAMRLTWLAMENGA